MLQSLTNSLTSGATSLMERPSSVVKMVKLHSLMFASFHESNGGRVQKQSGDGAQDDFHCWQKLKACCGVFGDEDDG